MRRFRSLILVTAVALLGAFAFGAPAQAANNFNHSVYIKNFTYRPNTLIVLPGSTITVRNADGQQHGIPHSLTSKTGLFDTQPFTTGLRTFTAPTAEGRYPFFCEVHPFMHGVLFVDND